MTEYKSKTVTVHRSQTELFGIFTNLEGLKAVLPADKAGAVDIDVDLVTVTYSGFTIGIRLCEKIPFTLVKFCSEQSPFGFNVTFHFDDAPLITDTQLWISVEADLNFMMKTLLGSKIQEGLDKVVTALSTGQMPEFSSTPSD